MSERISNQSWKKEKLSKSCHCHRDPVFYPNSSDADGMSEDEKKNLMQIFSFF